MNTDQDQSKRDLAAQIAGEGVTKEDHIAGYKVIEVNTKWGETSKLRITALGWRALQRLLRQSQEEQWDEIETSARIVMASLLDCKNDALLDHLDNASAVRLQRVVNALAFGERAISPNGAAPVPIKEAPAAAMSSNSEKPVSAVKSKSSPAPVIQDERLWDGALPASDSSSKSLAECAPSAT